MILCTCIFAFKKMVPCSGLCRCSLVEIELHYLICDSEGPTSDDPKQVELVLGVGWATAFALM